MRHLHLYFPPYIILLNAIAFIWVLPNIILDRTALILSSWKQTKRTTIYQQSNDINMKPENVNPSNFKVESILFDNGNFSIAYGKWKNETSNRIAMRWNGKDDDPGYPKLFKNPVWFFIDDSLKIPFMKSLIENKGSKHENIIESLKKELY